MSRTSLVLLLLLGLSLLTVSHNALAQSEGFFACGIAESFAYFMITVFVYYIVLLMWVAQDAKSRGMDNIVVWVLVVACLGYVGMIIYLIPFLKIYIALAVLMKYQTPVIPATGVRLMTLSLKVS